MSIAAPYEADEPCVAILLSTFNGDQYLGEQLNSFIAQTHLNWRLYWRDDGSSDGSPDLMNEFAQEDGPRRCVQVGGGGQNRATGSFLALLRTALRGPGAYFAYSDQDDVWLPDKLAHGVAALGKIPSGRPALYFCPRALVDARLRPIGLSCPTRRQPGFPAALAQNVIPGCCMMLNRAAAELINAIEAPERTWHDWWSYLVVTAGGGLVIEGDTPDILYRQHASNLVGEPLTFWRRTVAALRRGRDPFMTLLRRHVAALQARPALLPESTRDLLTIIARSGPGGPSARMKALRIPGFVRQTRLETLVFRLWFVLG